MKKIIVLTAMSLSGYVSAACPSSSTTIFSCTTSNNKIIQVCDAKKSISYTFGRTNQPELSISVPRNRASTYQWSGFGRNMNYTVNIPNGSTTYRVFSNIDKFDEYSGAGVEVEQNGNLLATVKCDESKPLINNIEGINLKPTE